ncbi:hypothetical protein F53441_11175 [Fusarium austroafricanum]|uniref:Uncharacterized protein n=1 Tax=Fusarium austroafricanum TaxID=2364996 RepID=A0A8H4K5W7_9HYPO|nr:hypothetical protein F53441_11175 [Fusarium austroafricanum]
MKTAIFVTALFGAAVCAPVPAPIPESDIDIASHDLETRGSCPAGQSCVSGWCTVYTCVSTGTGTFCYNFNLQD